MKTNWYLKIYLKANVHLFNKRRVRSIAQIDLGGCTHVCTELIICDKIMAVHIRGKTRHLYGVHRRSQLSRVNWSHFR